MIATRRGFGALAIALASTLLAACATSPGAPAYPPIVFVHGNGDSGALWQTTLWRFESKGWPTKHLHAVDMPFPLARDVDTQVQPGRTSTQEAAEFLKGEVDKVLASTGAAKVVLLGNSRGGLVIRNYIDNFGGNAVVSHAVLGGAPNHGVWAIKGFREGNEFSGTGPFLTALNSPKNVAGDEVAVPVQWLTVRSDKNDKFAQPDGLWIGAKGTPTNVSFDGPALKGATNVVLARIDHRETSFSPAAFEAAFRFITGKAPHIWTIEKSANVVLSGKVVGLGLNPQDAKSGDYVSNQAIGGAQLTVYATDAATGARLGSAVHNQVVGTDGSWGPLAGKPDTPYEFVIQAPGYAITHIYRSPFARSSAIVHVRAERLPAADKTAVASITFSRPRGYFDAQRDKMMFDGSSTLPGVPAQGAGVAVSKLLLQSQMGQAAMRSVSAEFNGEKITGLAWPAAASSSENGNHVVILELTY